MSKLISISLIPDTPTVEPITLQEAKDYCRIDFNDEDDLITSLIISARQKCEKYLGLCIVKTAVKALYENGGEFIELAYGPIELDGSGVPVIIGWDGDVKGIGNQMWIETEERELTLSYNSGFDSANYPEWVKEAVLKQVAWDYVHRGDEINPNIAPETKSILFPHRTTLHEFVL